MSEESVRPPKDSPPVIVRVSDRGPFVKGRIVDVSHSAAEQLGFTQGGVAKVKIDVVQ